MQKVVRTLLALVCFWGVGCTTMQFNRIPQQTQHDWPPLNQQTTVYIGDTMFTQGVLLTQKALQLSSPVKGTCYDIPSGIYAMTGEDENRYYSLATSSTGTVIRAALCDPFVGITVPKNTPGQVCVLTVYGINACYSAQYKIVDVETEHDLNLQQNLIYSGIIDKQIKLTYAERKKNGTLFSNNVSYDTKKSTIIHYKGAKIQVHSADNEKITYTVLENFTNRQ